MDNIYVNKLNNITMRILIINEHHYQLLNDNNKVIHTSTTERECIEYMNEYESDKLSWQLVTLRQWRILVNVNYQLNKQYTLQTKYEQVWII